MYTNIDVNYAQNQYHKSVMNQGMEQGQYFLP